MHAKGFFIVRNDRGLHTRPSTELVRLTSTFKCDLQFRLRKTQVSGKSLLGILMLAATKGSKIWVEAKGEDAEEALQAVLLLAQGNFHTKY